MDQPSFRRQRSSDPLYLWQPLAVGLSAYRIAFLPHDTPSGDAITLAESWQTVPGIYLFLGEEPVDQVRFAADLSRYLSGPQARFVWLENPNASSSEWRSSILMVDAAGSLTRSTDLRFRNFLLSLGAGCGVSLTDSGFTIRSTDVGGSISFWEGELGFEMPVQDAVALSFAADDSAGCLAFPLLLKSADAAALAIGCAYFVDHPVYAGYLQALAYPVFLPTNGDLTLYARLDPVNHLADGRTYLSFLAPGESTGTALASAFRGQVGEAVSLTPVLTEQRPRLVFSVRATTPESSQADPFYLTPAGPFRISTTGSTTGDGPAARLLCGISGVEYLGLPAAAGCTLVFVPGQNAYAPSFGGEASADSELLMAAAKTAWAYVLPPTATDRIGYYAQPDDASLYTIRTDPSHPERAAYLGFMELHAGELPPTLPTVSGNGPLAFPVAPFAGLDPAVAERCRALEVQIISRARRKNLARLLQPGSPAPLLRATADPDADQVGVTPQGLLATFDRTRTKMKALTLAQTGSGLGAQHLQFTDIQGGFRAALQSNQLFAVIRNPEVFLQNGSVNYMLTAEALAGLQRTQKVPAALLARLTTALQDRFCADKSAYITGLQGAVGSDYQPYLDLLLQYGAFCRVVIEGWTFDLSPYRWAEHGTMLLFKYASQSLEALAANPQSWAWPEAAQQNGQLADAQVALQQIIADAKARRPQEPDLAYFVDQVACNPAWNGVLCLNVPLGGMDLPPDLQGLAAGLDQSRFFAHHFGINATPISTVSGLGLGESSLFGLIDYLDRADLVDGRAAYKFKVLSLKVRFQNSVIVSFASQVELLINQLFGELAQATATSHGNNLIFTGVLQRQDGHDAYLFTQEGRTPFRLRSGVIEQVETTQAQFVTLRPPQDAAPSAKVKAQFLLTGIVRFVALPKVDLLSFGLAQQTDGSSTDGGLAFGNLIIGMEFDPATPGAQSFQFDAANLALDLAHSGARVGSLYSQFPLKLKGFLTAPPDTTPEGLGYIGVRSRQPQSRLTHPWYGLLCELQLGTLGALAANVGLTATLLVAWAPTGESASTYLGLKLPGSTSGSPEIPIEGVLKLGFRSIDLESQGGAYMMKFRTIALRLLSLSFPPGQVDLYLFGDPNGSANTGGNSALGWYAAYAKAKKKGGAR